MEEIKEEWRDIEGYSGLYQISNLGRVKALGNGKTHNSKEKMLKPFKNYKGYLQAALHQQGKRKMCKVHRLVAEAFIENPNNYPQINHRDECKVNNCVSNLEWCDSKYNNNYGTHNQRVAESNSKQVLCVETGIIYPSTKEVQRQLGFNQSSISKCCNGKLKTAYGHTWRYVE